MIGKFENGEFVRYDNGGVNIDDELSLESKNPVMNKVITEKINEHSNDIAKLNRYTIINNEEDILTLDNGLYYAYVNCVNLPNSEEQFFIEVTMYDDMYKVITAIPSNSIHKPYYYIKKCTYGTWSDWECYASTSQFSNPNLLINPDFKINQRGQSEYHISGYYTVDRWRLNTIGDGYLTVEGDGVSIHNTNVEKYTDIYYTFETDLIKGQKYTLSLDINGIRCSTIITGGEYNVGGLLLGVGHVILFYIKDIHEHLIFRIQYEVTSAKFSNAKLEQGSIATPFVIPDPATELMKCQRYYWKNKNHFEMSVSGAGISHKRLTVQYPVEMRTIPTVTFNCEDTTVSIYQSFNTGLYFITNTGTTFSTISSIIADAEIY